MRIIICENYEELSEKGAQFFESQITLKPDSVLGLATGGTPVGLYKNLIKWNKEGRIDFSNVTSFNLDEYYPIAPDNDQSYRYFMNENLFDHINIDKTKTYVPDGLAKDPDAECARYEELLAQKGPVDIQLLGIGRNGHIGFNEPDTTLNAVTHITSLTESTIEANARFFDNITDVPTKALTMGMGTILKSKKILMLVSGKEKHEVLCELLNDDISTSNPATLLKVHPDVVIICDKAAYEG
ncbi:MAG: glucosamine-6-phosphate deaminase [Clostridia bacterium]|nr:glucosamine-6-phosphate deaminase [Clostridia bacterium]